MRLKIDGAEVAPDRVCFNDGMNFGQFRESELERMGTYEMTFERAAFVHQFEAAYDAICQEIRADDAHFGDSSDFSAIGYAPMNEALDLPDLFGNIVEGFLLRDHIFPLTLSRETKRIVLNSIDDFSVEGDCVTIAGRYRSLK